MADADEVGVELQSISFRQGETGLVIEMGYAERRNMTVDGIMKFDALVFEARKAPTFVEELIEAAEDLIDEILRQKTNPPIRQGGRRGISSL